MTLTCQADGYIPGHPPTINQSGVGIRVTPSRAYLPFWQRVAAGRWEAHTLNILQRFNSPDRTMLDIGAWIGPTTLFGAHFAREVLALEPVGEHAEQLLAEHDQVGVVAEPPLGAGLAGVVEGGAAAGEGRQVAGAVEEAGCGAEELGGFTRRHLRRALWSR